jgi:nucleotide-binding universal stress UspA family protein
MFKTILLPVDLTDRHGPVLDVAGELAAQSKGEVILLHVIETISGVAIEDEREFYDRLERTARDHLDRLGKHLDEHKATWRAEVRYGNRARESVQYALAAAADLIILTAPRFDPAAPGAGWGSMSYRIGILSQCPVLLVK